jgi:type VI secretion system protein ImpG
MDPRLLKYYNRELQYLREMGAEFAKEFPKIAGRLGIEGLECADPYVERLLEGFGFLAARVHLKIDAEFPRFTRHLLEMVYPQYLSPTPSMAVVQFNPDLSEGSLAEGFNVPRLSVLRSLLGKREQTPCEYRTAHDTVLWPLEIAEAEYFTHARDLPQMKLPREIKAGLRLRFRTTAGLAFNALSLDRLPLYLRGSGDTPSRIYELLLSGAMATLVRQAGSAAGEEQWHEVVRKGCIDRVGFDDHEALLPYGPRSFHGYRMLREYFALPQRFMFVELTGLAPAVSRCTGNELDVIVLLDRHDAALQEGLDASNFALFCTPAINLFPKRTDRIHIDVRTSEYHVVPDRTRPMDFEVYQITSAVGQGTSAEHRQEFLPFYASADSRVSTEHPAYYSVNRVPRALSSKQRKSGTRSTYVGSEVFIALVDPEEAPFRSELRQLQLNTLCTNRDLPLHMSVGAGKTDFTMESSAPVQSVRCVAGPSQPRPSLAEGETAWRLISHLALNYVSLIDSDEHRGAAGLRELLRLYGDASEASIAKQIDGLRSVAASPVTRRLPGSGPISFGRGLEVTLLFDESAFEGTGVFVLGAVLEQFIARYVSINSFTETVIRSIDRGEIMRWPVRTGQRPRL